MACITVCKFFWNQRELKDAARGAMNELGLYVKDVRAPLRTLNREGLESCLGNFLLCTVPSRNLRGSSRSTRTGGSLGSLAQAQSCG